MRCDGGGYRARRWARGRPSRRQDLVRAGLATRHGRRHSTGAAHRDHLDVVGCISHATPHHRIFAQRLARIRPGKRYSLSGYPVINRSAKCRRRRWYTERLWFLPFRCFRFGGGTLTEPMRRVVQRIQTARRDTAPLPQLANEVADLGIVPCRARKCLTGATAIKLFIEKRGRASIGVDDAHLAADDIDKLRQRFDARESKDLTQRSWVPAPERDTRIQIESDSAESQHLETTAAESDAALSDQNGTCTFESDG